jgi:hypothetical protein
MTELLTARRRADRSEMAQAVCFLLGEYRQLTGTLRPEQDGSRKTSVEIEGPHGLKVTVHFDGAGANGPDTYVLSWHGVEDGVRLHWGMFGNVNRCHGCKATDVATGFAQLLRILRERFAVIADGSAFITEGQAGTS